MARTKMSARHSRPYTTEICGLYYVSTTGDRHYLPQVELKSYTTISSICYHTKLEQAFANTWNEKISELRYTFPLFDGVAVTAYTIEYDGIVLKGVVKQKDDAKQTYNEAVEHGETAGLLESLPAGVFGVTLGNVGPDAKVLVTIHYIGELKHDAQIDGLRFILPTAIAPRYGSYPGEMRADNVISKGISITVDIEMAGSAIRKIQSPSHTIAVSLGSMSSAADDAFDPSQGSITLTHDSTELNDDFVLQVMIDDISKPQAIIEKHPDLNSRAIMTTLVPKFNLPPISPEIIFIADQSGSMRSLKNDRLIAAMKVLLKSLPFGSRFNICAFGSSYKYLFDQAQAYNEDNLKKALDYVTSFSASMGGTEMLQPMQEAFKRRLGSLPLEVMLLTDGETWREQELIALINDEIHEKKVDARVFTLGIGSDVSHTLVEGVARAGNGFAQYVAEEQMDAKLMRMLRAALSPHLKHIQLEVNYDDRDVDEDDFEIVDKVQDCLILGGDEMETDEMTTDASSSFFDKNVDSETLTHPIKTQRYAHLPGIRTPKLLQAPSTIPPLFPFNRSTFYIILGPDASQKKAVSVTLRAQASTGPLELIITLQESQTLSTTVHQLAARRAVQELEEGRGWLHEARTTDGALVKQKYQERFDEIVEREAVRLGMTFNVAGKWCSFVAVQDGIGPHVAQASTHSTSTESPATARSMTVPSRGVAGVTSAERKSTGGKAPRKQLASHAARRSAPSPSVAGAKRTRTSSAKEVPGPVTQARSASPLPVQAEQYKSLDDGASPDEVARQIIDSQAFQGYWKVSDKMLHLLGLKHAQVEKSSMTDVDFTKMVLVFLETQLKSEMEMCEMVVEKAKRWLESQ